MTENFRHYRILEKIGQGGLGEVYVAEDAVLGRRVALKFLTSVGNESEQQQILEEARAAAAIDHPYACKVFEAAELDGRFVIVMEFLEGETLSHRLRSGPLAVQDALKLAVEISEALAEAHEKRIIHCDLKPANVMITRSGHVKLMDFGLARKAARVMDDTTMMLDTPTSPGVAAGTPGYMAPEQCRGENLDPSTDVFALGVVLFEMLTGTNPFRRDTLDTTLAAVCREDPPPIELLVPSVPPSLTPIIGRAMAKSPGERFQSAGQVLAELAGIQHGIAETESISGRLRLRSCRSPI